MKLSVQHDKESHEINFERDGENVVVQIDGRSYEISVREVDGGLCLISSGGDVYECIVEKDPARTDVITVMLRNRTFVATVINPRQLRSVSTSSVNAGDGSAHVTSPMAGKIVRVLVENGTRVGAGDGIVVVEAMKMQNELKAPRDGVVTELIAVEGTTVNAGDVLAVVEALTQ